MPHRPESAAREVAVRSREVALPHQDPADRFLVATALTYDLTLAVGILAASEQMGCERIGD